MADRLYEAKWEIRTSCDAQIKDNAAFGNRAISEDEWRDIIETRRAFGREWLWLLVHGFGVKAAVGPCPTEEDWCLAKEGKA